MSGAKTVNIQPSWLAVMHMLIMVIEHGTPEGKAMARRELLTIGQQLDDMLPGNAPDLASDLERSL